MTLQAKDLMVGDWVNIYEFPNKNPQEEDLFPAKISAITTPLPSEDGDEVVECYFVAFGGGVGCAARPIETCLPIPLTQEILEKNGWSDDYSGNHFPEDTDFELEISIEGKTVLWTINSYEYEIIRLSYVHELQHALKLCKIDKEIKL